MIYRPHVEGKANVPKTGPIIFASNHLSFSDSFFFPLLVSRRITFLAKADYFRLTGEVFEDDKLFELRMASFLDYYLYDRVSPLTGSQASI